MGHEGVTAVVWQKTLDEHASDNRLHVFDSFQGLPAPGTEDLRDGVPDTGHRTANVHGRADCRRQVAMAAL